MFHFFSFYAPFYYKEWERQVRICLMWLLSFQSRCKDMIWVSPFTSLMLKHKSAPLYLHCHHFFLERTAPTCGAKVCILFPREIFIGSIWRKVHKLQLYLSNSFIKKRITHGRLEDAAEKANINVFSLCIRQHEMYRSYSHSTVN